MNHYSCKTFYGPIRSKKFRRLLMICAKSPSVRSSVTYSSPRLVSTKVGQSATVRTRSLIKRKDTFHIFYYYFRYRVRVVANCPRYVLPSVRLSVTYSSTRFVSTYQGQIATVRTRSLKKKRVYFYYLISRLISNINASFCPLLNLCSY